MYEGIILSENWENQNINAKEVPGGTLTLHEGQKDEKKKKMFGNKVLVKTRQLSRLFICKEFCTFSSEWLSAFQMNIATITTCQQELEEFPGGALHVSQNSLRINKAFSRHDAHSLEVG